jgi:OH-DDVA oxygenase/3-O-methylgallate 3,4-dioxygenase
MEIFTADHVPAFAIVWGPYVEGIPRDEAFLAKLPPGVARAELDRTPSVYTQYPCHPELGEYLIRASMNDGFDPAQITKLTTGEIGSNAAPHAYGFVYRRIMRDRVLPHVPVVVNTFYPPNQPSARRCYEFGKSLGRALRAWPKDLRIAVIASGGLSHFVVDEEFDRKVLDIFERSDFDALTSLPEEYFESGTSEIKNWITTAGILEGFQMRVVDYLPCYRSEAGTGSGLGFAVWS